MSKIKITRIMKKDDDGNQHQVFPQTHISAVLGMKDHYNIDSIFDPFKDYTFRGNNRFSRPINAELNWFGKNDYNVLSHKPKLETITQEHVGFERIVNLSNGFGNISFQEFITNPRTGYRYGFSNAGDVDNELEDLVVIEYDQFMRIRSTMKVMHGVNKISWLHGQFTQFNYYNDDVSKTEFLLGGPGESVILNYQPDTTVNYDDLTVFFNVREIGSYTQAVDFDNNLVFSVILSRPAVGKYSFSFSVYRLEPNHGETTFIDNKSITIDIPDNYVQQGISVAPAGDYIGRPSNGSIIFATSGGTKTGSDDKLEGSLRTFLYEDGQLSEFALINNLYAASYLSTSMNRLSDYKSYRDQDEHVETYKEIEGSAQTKINGHWIFTTNLIYGRDNNNGNYSQRNTEQMIIAFGNLDSISSMKSIGHPKPDLFGLESDVVNIYDVILPGAYEISPTDLPTLLDAPVIFTGDSLNNIVGGSGVESVQLRVESYGIYGKVKQTLNINMYSATNQTDYVFTRYVRVNRIIGKSVTFLVGRWNFLKNKDVGTFSVFPKITKSTQALLPGYTRYITTSSLTSFFSDEPFIPAAVGLFETLDIEIPLESNNTSSRLLQRFTTYSETNIEIFQRVITVSSYGYSNVFPAGIGGGYQSIIKKGTWTKI